MKITDEQIDAIFGDSPFVARRKIDKSAYEVVQQTNDDWREVIGTDDELKHWGDFKTFEEAEAIKRRLHVRWVLGDTEHGVNGMNSELEHSPQPLIVEIERPGDGTRERTSWEMLGTADYPLGVIRQPDGSRWFPGSDEDAARLRDWLETHYDITY